MTREELEQALADVQKQLTKVPESSRAYIAGKEIEKAILQALGEIKE